MKTHDSKKRKNFLIGYSTGCLTFFVVLSLLIILSFRSDRIESEKRLDKFAGELFSIELPPETELLERKKEIAIVGSGGFPYNTAMLFLKSGLSKSELEDFYSQKTIGVVYEDEFLEKMGVIDLFFYENGVIRPEGNPQSYECGHHYCSDMESIIKQYFIEENGHLYLVVYSTTKTLFK